MQGVRAFRPGRNGELLVAPGEEVLAAVGAQAALHLLANDREGAVSAYQEVGLDPERVARLLVQEDGRSGLAVDLAAAVVEVEPDVGETTRRD